MWSGAQYWPIAQSASATQSAQTPRAVSHTCSSALHSRDERQGVGGATQLLRSHTAPPVQSALVTQSTQRPAAVSHTWLVHVRDVVQGTAATQRFIWHTGVAPLQSPAVTQATQRIAARSHTRPMGQPIVLRQAIPASTGAMSGDASAATSSGALSTGAPSEEDASVEVTSPPSRASPPRSVGCVLIEVGEHATTHAVAKKNQGNPIVLSYLRRLCR